VERRRGVNLTGADLTEPMADGALQPDGTVRPEPRMDVADVARTVRYRPQGQSDLLDKQVG
jgi:hypothetical protein